MLGSEGWGSRAEWGLEEGGGWVAVLKNTVRAGYTEKGAFAFPRLQREQSSFPIHRFVWKII